MKKMTPEKKVTWIIHTVTVLMVIVLVALVHYTKAKYDLPTVVLYACYMPLFIGTKVRNFYHITRTMSSNHFL